MDWLTFIATMTGHLAWPIVGAGVVWLFRRSIIERLPYLRRASWGDKSLEFSEGLGEAAEKAVQLEPPEDQKSLPPPAKELLEDRTGDEQFASALEASPRFAVLQAWFPIEQELQRIARQKGYSADRTRSPTYAIRQLQNDATIDGETAALLKDLLRLRNLASHGGHETGISTSEALEYRTIADLVVEKLRRVA